MTDIHFQTLFYKHRPNGDETLMNKAKAALTDAGHIKQIGPKGMDIILVKDVASRAFSYKDNPLKSLTVLGFALIPTIIPRGLHVVRDHIMDAQRHFQEYNRHPDNSDMTPDYKPIVYVASGNAAQGSCSSFHNHVVRDIREKAAKKARELFAKVAAAQPDPLIKNTKMQMLFDRLLVRREGQTPPAETWHRDEANPAQIGKFDEIFGGWINLNNYNQQFSFIPGSHLGIYVHDLSGGFASIDKYHKDNNTPSEQCKAEIAELNSHKYVVDIPPGYMIIFPQYIMHEIVAKACEITMVRLFLGWRLTRHEKSIYLKAPSTSGSRKRAAENQGVNPKAAPSKTSYYDDPEPAGEDMLDSIISTQGLPQLPGSMMPAMYAQNHLRYYQNKDMLMLPNDPASKMSLMQWSQSTFVPKVLESSGLVHRFMPSLEACGFTKYKEYSAEEIGLYKSFQL